MFPVDAGIDPRTLRRHTLKAGAALADRAAARPPAAAPAITVTVDSTFIRSREDGLHRWLSWSPRYSRRCWHPGTADARLVPYRDETSTSQTNWRWTGGG